MIFKEPLSELIWNTKYRYRYHDEILDHTPEDTWKRIATAVSQAEILAQQPYWQNQFYSILRDFQFLPGGRIIAGAGTQHLVTLFNCFVMPIEDSLNGIFDSIKEGALTLQQGGGVGYDFSVLRPKGALVKKTESSASGPVSFMRIWNAMCATMLSTGARRGAMMGVLRCDHPDIEEFIIAKSDPHELRHFNVSVLVSDAFMEAVKQNVSWPLVFPLEKNEKTSDEVILHSIRGNTIPCRVFRRINARDLWHRIIQSAYDYAEPGVLFEDTINRMNNLNYREWISATNPCGEIPLPSYGACNLGSLNLTQFVLNPFSEDATLNWKDIEKTVAIATRFLDNVIDISSYPLEAQHKEALKTRRIGLGLTGLGDTLVMLNIHYESKAALTLASQMMKLISEVTWKTSIELAKERSAFPLFNAEKYLAGGFVKRLPNDIKKAIETHGVRHSHHNTIAPTGTISLFANNVSNGLEPIFGPIYKRTVRDANGELMTFSVMSYALRLWRETHSKDSFPPAWSDIQSLHPDNHLQIQRAMQPYIDNAISKTINIPADYPFEKLAEVYDHAYSYGLKGCTVFRPNAVTGNVLKTISKDDSDQCCQF